MMLKNKEFICPQCDGTGKKFGCELWAYEYPCEKCGGSGSAFLTQLKEEIHGKDGIRL